MQLINSITIERAKKLMRRLYPEPIELTIFNYENHIKNKIVKNYLWVTNGEKIGFFNGETNVLLIHKY